MPACGSHFCRFPVSLLSLLLSSLSKSFDSGLVAFKSLVIVSGCYVSSGCIFEMYVGFLQACQHIILFLYSYLQKLHVSHIICTVINLTCASHLCHMVGPDLLSHGFYSTYQIFFILSDTGIGFIRVNRIDSDTFQGLNPNFRVGQLLGLAKIQVSFFIHFKQK